MKWTRWSRMLYRHTKQPFSKKTKPTTNHWEIKYPRYSASVWYRSTTLTFPFFPCFTDKKQPLVRGKNLLVLLPINNFEMGKNQFTSPIFIQTKKSIGFSRELLYTPRKKDMLSEVHSTCLNKSFFPKL